MADKLQNVNFVGDTTGRQWVWHDNGDGTFSPSVYATTGTITTTPSTAGTQNVIGTTAGSTGDAATPGNVLEVRSLIRYFNGATWDRVRVANVYKLVVNGTSVTAETTVWTPANGKKFRLLGFDWATSAAGEYILRDGVGGTAIYRRYGGANAAALVNVGNGAGILSAAANNVLTVQGPATATLTAVFWGTEE